MVLGDLEFLLRIIHVSFRVLKLGVVKEGKYVPHLHNIIHMITQSHKQIKEKFPTTFHFRLHGSAPLKCLATSNNQGQVMSAEPRVRVRRVVIRIPSTAQNRSDLDPTLQALLPKSKALELLESVFLCCTVYDCIPQKVFSHAGDVDCRLDGSATTCIFGVWGAHGILEFPRVSALVVHQAGVIVALLQMRYMSVDVPAQNKAMGRKGDTYVKVLENT